MASSAPWAERLTQVASPQPPSLTPGAITAALLEWFARHGRSFPWRDTSDSYQVLIAEILLRKTGSRTVDRFLHRFFTLYPDMAALACAPVAALADELSVLGLSGQRARQLHDLARSPLLETGREIPSSVECLAALPGVGRYTAGIVAATSFGIPAPAVDTNVARVLCRVFGAVPSHAEARKSANIWALASAVVESSHKSPARVTWAMLDLAAAVCTPRKPRCETCPLYQLCVYAYVEQGVQPQ